MVHPPESKSGERLGLDLEALREPHPSFRSARVTLPEAQFRHSGWRRQRAQVWAAMQQIDPYRSSLYQFANCGANCHLLLSEDGKKARWACNHCRNRWCQPCCRSVAWKIQTNLMAHTGNRVLRFLTLTLKHTDSPLREQIKKLMTCWRKLRTRKEMSQRFMGGVTTLEIKLSEHDARWHPHLHVLFEGSFIDARWLSRLWMELTTDSNIVNVKMVKRSQDAVRYVCKYISKPVDNSVLADPGRLIEAMEALSGVKTVSTFGLWRGLRLTARPVDDVKWRVVADLRTFLEKMKARDPYMWSVAAVLERVEGAVVIEPESEACYDWIDTG